MTWSKQAWKQAEPIYKKILELPFIKELSDGSLSRERFMFYIKQDALYVENYAHVLAHVASRLPKSHQMEAFLQYALGGIAMERSLHASYIGTEGLGDTRPTPTCLLYNSYEACKGVGPVEIEAASTLPCFWVYQRVGTHILNNSDVTEANPYKPWIMAYADPFMEESTQGAIRICDELAEAASEDVRKAMTEAFVMSTKMEWMFWHSAYVMEKWEV